MTIASLALALVASAVAPPAQDSDVGTALEASYRKAAERAQASVVAIKVEREAEAAPPPRGSGGGRVGFPFGPGVFSKRPAGAWCSGLVAEADGTILTTFFNVSGKVKSITVRLADGRELPGKLLGYDAVVDLAAIKVEASGLPVLKPARVEDLRTGQTVVALGRAPDGAGLTVNPGIVSAPSRMAGRGIQTDAKINYGNVGGPLVDAEGRLLAVTCKTDNREENLARGQNSGVALAVTLDQVGAVLPQLKAGKAVAEARRPFLGVQANNESTVPGVELASVSPGAAAEKAGLKAGDIIMEFDGKKILNFDELRAAIGRKSPGDKVRIKYSRGEAEVEVECELGSDRARE